uniref:Uncharacterized protein n=1 Tax=Anguilla anguilla TaxID=7936 RepID=A0A0E9XSQ9_ANGAN
MKKKLRMSLFCGASFVRISVMKHYLLIQDYAVYACYLKEVKINCGIQFSIKLN